MEFLHVGQTGLELPTSGDLPALAFQSAGIIGVSHHTWLCPWVLNGLNSHIKVPNPPLIYSLLSNLPYVSSHPQPIFLKE